MCFIFVLFVICVVLFVYVEEMFFVMLVGYVWLFVLILVILFVDVLCDVWLLGKFIGKICNDSVMSVLVDIGKNYGNYFIDLFLFFIGQLVQGMLGFVMNCVEDGSIYMLIDNGFGFKINSFDVLLFFYCMNFDFIIGKVQWLEIVFLCDFDYKVFFCIVYEGIEGCYLIGVDFDLESIQVLNDEIWIGDEFGFYIICVIVDGWVILVYQIMLDGVVLNGFDMFGMVVLVVLGKDFCVQCLGGYEGMVLQLDINLLWVMLEKLLLGDDGMFEGDFLCVMIFDFVLVDWIGDSFCFKLVEGVVVIGDFNFIDVICVLVIECDVGEGDVVLVCVEGVIDILVCYLMFVKVKNIVLVDIVDCDVEGYICCIGYIDLMNIVDFDGKVFEGMKFVEGFFIFLFQIIEDVMCVDDIYIIVVNDNNLFFLGGCEIGKVVNNEFILLFVFEFFVVY